MADASQIHKGLGLLLEHDPSISISVEHDTIYAGGEADASEALVREMNALDWIWSDVHQCFLCFPS